MDVRAPFRPWRDKYLSPEKRANRPFQVLELDLSGLATNQELASFRSRIHDSAHRHSTTKLGVRCAGL
jgi:hypothetical protein